jgi:hypothetical protein
MATKAFHKDKAEKILEQMYGKEDLTLSHGEVLLLALVHAQLASAEGSLA